MSRGDTGTQSTRQASTRFASSDFPLRLSGTRWSMVSYSKGSVAPQYLHFALSRRTSCSRSCADSADGWWGSLVAGTLGVLIRLETRTRRLVGRPLPSAQRRLRRGLSRPSSFGWSGGLVRQIGGRAQPGPPAAVYDACTRGTI